MTELEMVAMIKHAKVGNSLHLYHRHGLDKFTKNEVGILVDVLKRDYKTLNDLALEDLSLSDEELIPIASLVESLPLTKFSWQGLNMGDRCIVELCDHLRVSSACQMKSLEVGGLMASDSSLEYLAQLIIAKSSLQEVSINWSPYFSLASAWRMAILIAIQNISLQENNFHGFFHSVESDDLVGIDFINGFLSMVIKRNNAIVNTKNNDHYAIYKQFNSQYHNGLTQNFLCIQKLYDLSNFSLQDLQYQPLTLDPFLLRLAPLFQSNKSAASPLVGPASSSSSSGASPFDMKQESLAVAPMGSYKSCMRAITTDEPAIHEVFTPTVSPESETMLRSPLVLPRPMASSSPSMTAIAHEDSIADLASLAKLDAASIAVAKL